MFNLTFLILISKILCSSKKFLIDYCVIVFSEGKFMALAKLRSKFFKEDRSNYGIIRYLQLPEEYLIMIKLVHAPSRIENLFTVM